MGCRSSGRGCRRHAGRRAAVLLLVLFAGTGLSAGSARANGERSVHGARYTSQSQRPQASGKRYAIEFRSRYALSYGHAFVMFGPINGKGEFAERTVAGLHPAGDDPTPLMLGHLIPVSSETGPSDGDLEDQYVSARYRVALDRNEYDRVVAYIRQRQASNPAWHVLFNNCIQFIGDIGSYMGLKLPPPQIAYPQKFIEDLASINAGNDRSTARSKVEAP